MVDDQQLLWIQPHFSLLRNTSILNNIPCFHEKSRGRSARHTASHANVTILHTVYTRGVAIYTVAVSSYKLNKAKLAMARDLPHK